MREFVTSDWHIGHENVLKFDNRPFRDLDHMNERLIKNYNEEVSYSDTCYFLGDMGLANSERMSRTIRRLKGIKVLVLGNHDKARPSMIKSGFDVVIYGMVTYIAGQRVTLSHCPLLGVYREPTDTYSEAKQGNWHGEKKNGRFTFSDEGQFHLHGHIHSRPDTEHKPTKTNRQWDVGVAGNFYRPVSFSSVESWITKTLKSETTNKR